ncbi:MAG TPA: hypothetical protein GXX37_03830 [Clostridiaceae bacterium]|nr:hypothetical protein [Clostridiaceae bacterium]
MAKGDIIKNDIVSFRDEEFGYLIIKPFEADMTRTMYFTSNPFCNDNEHIIISTVRNDCENFYLLNYKTGEAVQLTDHDRVDIVRSYFDKKRNYLYYSTGRELRRVDIFTLKDESIYKSKTDMQSIGITCDGKFLVTSCACDYEYKNNDGHSITTKMYRMFKVNLETGIESHILYRNFEIDHIQCNPVIPDDIMFCSRGYFACNHRIWRTNLDGTSGGAIGPEQPNEHRTHEYYTPSGKKIAYHGKFFTVNEELRFEKILDTFGTMNIDGSEDKYYKCPKGLSPIHSCMSPTEDLIICDQKNYLSIIKFNDETMELEYENIYRHDSTMSCNFVHPHPSISNDGRYVVFATDRGGKDKGNIYLLDLHSK